MSWMLRHQGSPQHASNLTLAQIVEGLQDGTCDVTDEVRGPEDTQWVAIEDHPKLAEVVEEMEAQAPVREDEGGIDMNALIDVCLVLLIFFILTTSYEILEKVLQMPKSRTDDPQGVKVVAQEQVDNFMIKVKTRQEAGKTTIWVEDSAVADGELQSVLSKLARQSRKTEVLLDAAGVDYGTVIKIIDAAGGAKIDHVHFLVRPGTSGEPGA
jgi:biopolymer transport protein ExbD